MGAASEVALAFDYGSTRKSEADGLVPVLRMGNIQEGQLDWSNLVYTSDPGEAAKYALAPGDLLFNRTNSPDLVGKTAVFRADREAIFAGYLIRVRFDKNVLPEYVAYHLNSARGRTFCASVKVDGLSQSNINARKLSSFSIPLLEGGEQNRIVEALDKQRGESLAKSDV